MFGGSWVSGIRQSPAESYSAWIRRVFAPHPAFAILRDPMAVDNSGSPADILQMRAMVSKIVAEAKGGGMV